MDDVVSSFHRLARRRFEGRLFWSLTVPKVEHMVKSQLSELGLLRQPLSPHCLRLGGASHDAHHGLLLAEVLKGGNDDLLIVHRKLLRPLRVVASEQLLEARAAADCLPTALKAAVDRQQ